MKALDLFCGLGGWSDGLALEGFEVLGIEIEPRIAKLYKHQVICADINSLVWSKFKGFDLIVGSPPCRDFTRMCDTFWKKKKDPNNGLKLVYSFLGFIHEANPQYWLMENVPGLSKYIGEPTCYVNLTKTMKRAFWGEFPQFLIPTSTKGHLQHINTSIRSWERAKIPIGVSRSLGRTLRA